MLPKCVLHDAVQSMNLTPRCQPVTDKEQSYRTNKLLGIRIVLTGLVNYDAENRSQPTLLHFYHCRNNQKIMAANL